MNRCIRKGFLKKKERLAEEGSKGLGASTGPAGLGDGWRVVLLAGHLVLPEQKSEWRHQTGPREAPDVLADFCILKALFK